MNIYMLLYFHVSADSLNISRAARSCNYNQKTNKFYTLEDHYLLDVAPYNLVEIALRADGSSKYL